MQSINVSIPNPHGPSTFQPNSARDANMAKNDRVENDLIEEERVQTLNTPRIQREIEPIKVKNPGTPVKKQMNFQKVHN